jgi:hypothetical protein
MGLSLDAINLEIILKMTLHKDMGQNLSTKLSPLILGINVMKVALNTCRMDMELWDSSTTSQMSVTNIGHPSWKNSILKTSNPEAFP